MASPTEHSKSVAAALKGLAQKLKVERVVDGFTNLVTGIGTSRSKTSHGEYVADNILDCPTLEALFESNDLAYVIVSKIVEDALRDGFQLEREGGSSDADEEEAREIMRRFDELCGRDRIFQAAIWGRLFGDGGLILGVRTAGNLDDPQTRPYLKYGMLATPLKDETVTGIEMLVEWDRQDMAPYSWYPDGEPELFMWTPPPTHGANDRRRPTLVHESRLLRFHGAVTTSRGRQRNQGWHHSVLQRVYNALKSFDAMFASTDAMFADASQAVFKLQGLIQSLAEADGSGSADVQTRLQLMDLLRSSAKAIVLDAGDETGTGAEDFSVVDRASLGGLDGVIDKYYVRLAAAARMPLTVLLGMSPAGMDATGESDMILYYNTVDIYRKAVLQARILRVLRMIARELGSKDPEKWTIAWPELARPKPLDVATAEKMNVDSCVALTTAQVILPEEFALSLRKIARDGIRGLVIDRASREKAMTEALKELGDREMTGPTKEEEPEGVSPAGKSSERKTPSKAAGKQV